LYTVIYNGIDCRNIGLKVVKRPDIPIPARRITSVTIPGRSGDLHIDDGTYEPIEITIKFNFLTHPDDWGSILRQVREWLRGEKDKRFFLGDDGCYYYKVEYTQVEDGAERQVKQLGVLDVVFVCDPYQYETVGDRAIPLPCRLHNSGETSRPQYKITGEGMCTLTINGKSVTANVGQELTIDTDLMIAYRAGDVQNTALLGDFEDLYLTPGQNILEITDGFSVTVTPRWRHI